MSWGVIYACIGLFCFVTPFFLSFFVFFSVYFLFSLFLSVSSVCLFFYVFFSLFPSLSFAFLCFFFPVTFLFFSLSPFFLFPPPLFFRRYLIFFYLFLFLFDFVWWRQIRKKRKNSLPFRKVKERLKWWYQVFKKIIIRESFEIPQKCLLETMWEPKNK